MHYELWDVETANVVGHFADQDSALEVVAASYKRYGSVGVEHLALGLEPDESEEWDDAALPPVLAGAELLERALALEMPGRARR
jgi:hypothetical protein